MCVCFIKNPKKGLLVQKLDDTKIEVPVFVLIMRRQDAVEVHSQWIHKLPYSVAHIQHLQEPAADGTY